MKLTMSPPPLGHRPPDGTTGCNYRYPSQAEVQEGLIASARNRFGGNHTKEEYLAMALAGVVHLHDDSMPTLPDRKTVRSEGTTE